MPEGGTASRRLSVSRFELGLFTGFLFLAVFHIPVLTFGGDSIGLFDLYLVAYAIYLLLNPFRTGRIRNRIWRDFLLLFAGWLVYLWLHLLWFYTPMSLLLFLKNAEYGVIFLCCVIVFETYAEDTELIGRRLRWMLLLLAVFTVFRFLQLLRTGGFSSIARLGLPFTSGVSSNPAGFVLGFGLLILLFEREKGRSRFWLLPAAAVALAFVLTLSRTNILGFLLAAGLWALAKIARRARRVFLLGIVLVVLYAAVVILAERLPRTHWLYYLLRIFLAPGAILSDRSFALRYTLLWPVAFTAWLENLFTVLLGKGLAYLPVVDGTVPRLLANKGLVGLLLFAAVWFVFFLANFRNSRRLGFLLIFVLVNSVNAETLIVSFRAVQVYIPLLLYALYRFDRPQPESTLSLPVPAPLGRTAPT